MKKWILLGIYLIVGSFVGAAEVSFKKPNDGRERLSKENLSDFLKAQQRKALWSATKESSTEQTNFPCIQIRGNKLFIENGRKPQGFKPGDEWHTFGAPESNDVVA